MPEVILYTKPGCCLCDKVKRQLGSLRAAYPFEYREINILDDPSAYAKFHQQIPVVCIDGREAFKYHLDEQKFLLRLSAGHVHGETNDYEA